MPIKQMEATPVASSSFVLKLLAFRIRGDCYILSCGDSRLNYEKSIDSAVSGVAAISTNKSRLRNCHQRTITFSFSPRWSHDFIYLLQFLVAELGWLLPKCVELSRFRSRLFIVIQISVKMSISLNNNRKRQSGTETNEPRVSIRKIHEWKDCDKKCGRIILSRFKPNKWKKNWC